VTAKSTGSGDERHIDERVSEWMRWYGPIAVIAVGLATGAFLGPSMAVLVLAAGTLVGAIATFWTSIRALFGETRLTGEDAYALGAPTAEEEQKRAVLRAIKDIDYERRVGKISEDDHLFLMAKYRSEAKRLLRLIDDKAQPQRKRVERLVSDHLASRGMLPQLDDEPFEGEDDEERPSTEPASDEESVDDRVSGAPDDDDEIACSSCEVMNDADAAFCRKCGSAMDHADDDDADDDHADDDDADDDHADDDHADDDDADDDDDDADDDDDDEEDA
jgi:hypothetical protein